MLPCPTAPSMGTFSSLPFPSHPLSLLCLKESLCILHCLLLPSHLLNHKPAVLRWSCLGPRWSALQVHMSRCLRADFACCVPAYGVHFLPGVRLGTVCATHWSQDSVTVISSLTLAHLYSSVRLETGSAFSIQHYITKAPGNTQPLFGI